MRVERGNECDHGSKRNKEIIQQRKQKAEMQSEMHTIRSQPKHKEKTIVAQFI